MSSVFCVRWRYFQVSPTSAVSAGQILIESLSIPVRLFTFAWAPIEHKQ